PSLPLSPSLSLSLSPSLSPSRLPSLSPLPMPDFRVYCQPPEREPSEIRPSADESHHLVAVNRAKSGDTVVAFDGRGNEWICELLEDAKHAAVLKVRFRQKIRPLPYEIT